VPDDPASYIYLSDSKTVYTKFVGGILFWFILLQYALRCLELTFNFMGLLHNFKNKLNSFFRLRQYPSRT